MCSTSEYNLTLNTFPKLLKLALCYGWIPLGTQAPSEKQKKSWKGEYFEMCGQYVTPEDAENIAIALAKAVDEMPSAEDESYLVSHGAFLNFLLSEFKEKLEMPCHKENAVLLSTIQNYIFEDDIEKFMEFCRIGEGFVIL